MVLGVACRKIMTVAENMARCPSQFLDVNRDILARERYARMCRSAACDRVVRGCVLIVFPDKFSTPIRRNKGLCATHVPSCPRRASRSRLCIQPIPRDAIRTIEDLVSLSFYTLINNPYSSFPRVSRSVPTAAGLFLRVSPSEISHSTKVESTEPFEIVRPLVLARNDILIQNSRVNPTHSNHLSERIYSRQRPLVRTNLLKVRKDIRLSMDFTRKDSPREYLRDSITKLHSVNISTDASGDLPWDFLSNFESA